MRGSVLVIVGIAVLFSLSAAMTWGRMVGAGLEAGLNIAKLHGDDTEDLDSRVSFCAGGFITLSRVDMFAFQPELLYTRKGAEWEEEFDGETFRGTVAFDYLEIPVLAKLSFPMPGTVKPNLFFGPSLGILLSAKSKGEFEDVLVEIDIKDETKGTDFGLVVGGGLDFDLGLSKVIVSARYTLGLTSVDDSPEEFGGPFDVKNGVVSAMMGYSF